MRTTKATTAKLSSSSATNRLWLLNSNRRCFLNTIIIIDSNFKASYRERRICHQRSLVSNHSLNTDILSQADRLFNRREDPIKNLRLVKHASILTELVYPAIPLNRPAAHFSHFQARRYS